MRYLLFLVFVMVLKKREDDEYDDGRYSNDNLYMTESDFINCYPYINLEMIKEKFKNIKNLCIINKYGIN